MSNHSNDQAPLFSDPTYTAAVSALEHADAATEYNWHAEELAQLAKAREHLDTLTRMAVYKARAGGETWEQIAASLGTTRQNAWQRYGRPSDRD